MKARRNIARVPIAYRDHVSAMALCKAAAAAAAADVVVAITLAKGCVCEGRASGIISSRWKQQNRQNITVSLLVTRHLVRRLEDPWLGSSSIQCRC